jgi:Bacterial membrane protein YfhO
MRPQALSRPKLAVEAATILSLALFSFFVTSYFFLNEHRLYWDTSQHFGQFRDNLHALNAFGQIAWWFPQNQFGWPSYYYSVLGFPHGASPLFAATGFTLWLLGRLGMRVTNYHRIYVAYFAFLTPLLFLVSVRIFVGGMLKDRRAILYALILAAFSPGVVLNLGDIGFLEPAALALLFAAALPRFLGAPTRLHFFLLGLSAMALGTSLNFSFLFWDAVAIPAFLAAIWWSGAADRVRLRHVTARFKPWEWALLAGLVLIAASPNLVAALQPADLVKPELSGTSYNFEELRPGNPLEFLSASLPGFGMDWLPSYRGDYSLLVPKAGAFVGFSYLGLLAVPLALFGLLQGRRPVRTILLLLFLIVFGVVNLAGYSPLFALLLALPTPLRSVNHFSDVLFRGGGFILLIVAAAAGLDLVLQRPALRMSFLKGFAALTALGLSLLAWASGTAVMGSTAFGFSLATAVALVACLFWLAHDRSERGVRLAAQALLLVALLDVSTHVFLHVREHIRGSRRFYDEVDERPSPTGIGMVGSGSSYYYANSALSIRSLLDVIGAGIKPGELPHLKIFSRAHVAANLSAESAMLDRVGYANIPSLALSTPGPELAEFKPFFTDSPRSGSEAYSQIQVIRETYNDLEVSVSSPEAALLFVRDAYSPRWQALVNGRRVPIARALHHFKAVVVPAGTSTVRLAFSPPGLGLAIFAAYFCLLAVAAYCVRLARREI